MTVENKQLTQLLRDGFTPAEVASALGLELEAVQLAVSTSVSNERKVKSADELINKFKPGLIQLLNDIALDENNATKDRIAAARVIVTGEGILPELSASTMSEMFKRMKKVSASSSSSTSNEVEDTSKIVELVANSNS